MTRLAPLDPIDRTVLASNNCRALISNLQAFPHRNHVTSDTATGAIMTARWNASDVIELTVLDRDGMVLADRSVSALGDVYAIGDEAEAVFATVLTEAAA